MFYVETERQRRFVGLAAALAEPFVQRATDQDRSGEFPFENFEELRAAGLPALAVPLEYGGWGADLLETMLTMERLAVGDGSTALSLTMHMQTIGSAAEAGGWPEPLFAEVCTAAVTRGALINACASEPELGSPSRGGKPKTIATPLYHAGQKEPYAWSIEGRKSYASMAPALDYLIIPATLQDGAEDVARFVVPKGNGVRVVETWNAMGMRTTGSHDIVLSNVIVPAGNMVARTSQSTGGGANAWFQLCVSAVYVGVGQAALKSAAQYATRRTPTALGRPIATLESIQRHLGQAELLLHQAHLVLVGTAEMWMRAPGLRSEMGPALAAAKLTATNHAVMAVDHAMRAAGGASMSRALPLERYYRDVRAGLSHPISDDEAYVMLGKNVLTEVAAAL